MNQRNIIILVVAGVLGLVAVYLANAWFSGVEERTQTVVDEQDLVTIAVASQELPFGAPLTEDNVRMVSWPANSVPVGAYSDFSQIEPGRVAIRPIEVGEPILSSRISERAILSKNLPVDMRAVTIPVNAVDGVAGFVMPGDVVDVMFTREDVTSVLLENVPVLAIDRRSSERNTEPAVVDTATLQVDPVSAQRITLARQAGTLSLALRNVENQDVGATPRITLADIGGGYRVAPRRNTVARAPAPSPAPRASVSQPSSPPARSGPRMSVVRGTATSEYEVQRYGSR